MYKNNKIIICLVMLLQLSLFCSVAFAYDAPGYKWPINNATYVFLPSIPDSWKPSILNAARTWSIPSKFSFYSDGNSQNSWGASNYGSAGPIAWTNIRKIGNTITSVATDFNTAMPFGFNEYGKYDVESVALHEFGHWLYLGHSSFTSAVMANGTLYKGNIRRDLHSDDKNGIIYLYGN